QIRADLDDPRTRDLAEAFAAPVMINARLRDGSLRAAARERGAAVLLYEAGEAWRFDAWAIEAGVVGVRRVLAALGMVDRVEEDMPTPSLVSRSSGWVRARRTGILQLDAVLGQRVESGDRLGSLSDSFGKTLRLVHADRSGIVVGRTTTPLVNRGDALIHIAGLEPNRTGAEAGGASEDVEEQVETLPHGDLDPDLS
ncbi:MAG TPA: succinylglutamate desuccinylase/aspartoacylase family protein, partial [Intrasporangium sp.]|nr:succinylglutamate desuccinylase/aspartoacylase family protein [Intrasporangium sp.]